jgi:hypothetical protein
MLCHTGNATSTLAVASYRKSQADHICLVVKRLCTLNQLLPPCHVPRARRWGASGGGIGGGVSTERIPRDTPPNLARRGEIATKTQELISISNCDALPNCACAPAGPLRSFSGVCDGGVVRTDRHSSGERRRGSTQQFVGGC